MPQVTPEMKSIMRLQTEPHRSERATIVLSAEGLSVTLTDEHPEPTALSFSWEEIEALEGEMEHFMDGGDRSGPYPVVGFLADCVSISLWEGGICGGCLHHDNEMIGYDHLDRWNPRREAIAAAQGNQ